MENDHFIFGGVYFYARTDVDDVLVSEDDFFGFEQHEGDVFHLSQPIHFNITRYPQVLSSFYVQCQNQFFFR